MREFLGDWPILRANGISKERLNTVFNLVTEFPARGYIVKDNSLIFVKYDTTESTSFPAWMGPDECVSIAFRWLSVIDYPPEPDHDGSNKKGWLVETGDWGRVDGVRGSFLAVKPYWIMYGK